MLGGINPLMMGAGGVAGLKPQDVVAVTLYTGNASIRSIVSGVDVATNGGLIITKTRSTNYDPSWWSTARGASQWMRSNSTAAASTASGVTAFNTNGFDLGSLSDANHNAATIAAWSICCAPKFFDVRLISHTNGFDTTLSLAGLGVIGFATAKRTTATGDWIAFHRSLTASNNLRVNSTAAQSTTDAWVSISGTTLTLSASAPTGDYEISAFAHDTDGAGIVQCGSFTTDGSGNGSFATGWANGAQIVQIKCITTTGDWEILDTTRTPSFSGNDARLRLNVTNAEDSVSRLSQSSGTLSFTGLSASQTYAITAIRAPI